MTNEQLAINLQDYVAGHEPDERTEYYGTEQELAQEFAEGFIAYLQNIGFRISL